MAGIVLELQQLAADGTTSAGDLIRKARMVATKLKLTEINEWLGHELLGYPDSSKVRDYRVIAGDLRARNPVNGSLMPVRFGADLTEAISTFRCHQSIGNLDGLLSHEPEMLEVALNPRELEFVQRLFDPSDRSWVLPFRLISQTQVHAIIDRVRGIILDWALELEAKGILGNEMTFTPDEQERAGNIHIGSFQGVLGNVSHSNVTQNLQMNVKRNDFESLREMLLGMKLPESEVAELKAALDADEPPKAKGHWGQRVSKWFGEIAGKVASGAYKLTVDAALDHITKGVWQYYGF